uniref:Uncharacterized protein n=1 Tax=Canis lupus familiaris TaxID=9615 RepID=A0A8I3Q7Q0_CANLF
MVKTNDSIPLFNLNIKSCNGIMAISYGSPLLHIGRTNNELTMNIQKDVQSQKHQPVILIWRKCHTESEIKSRYPIEYRECEYRVIYKRKTKIVVVSNAQ